MRQDVVQMLAELVAVPSVSSIDPAFDMSNRPAVDCIAGWLDDCGLSVRVDEVHERVGKVNMVARLGPEEPGLVLSGHSDTVPCDAERWDSDPFTLSERDGRLYGLGTADMKSFFPLVVAALEGLPVARMRRGLAVLATADEECTMSGARALAPRLGSLGRFAVIGEPTGMAPVYLHKGILMAAITVVGRSGHASDPARGLNALEGMLRVVRSLIAWREALARAHRNDSFDIPVPTLNLGTIHGGDNPNRICGRCELQVDLRLLPEQQPEAVWRELEARVAEALAGTAYQWEVRALLPPVPALSTPRDSDLLRVAERLCARPARSVAFATEGPWFSAAGVDTIILGAGDIEQAHRPNEFVPADRLSGMVGCLRSLIERLCLEEVP